MLFFQRLKQILMRCWKKLTRIRYETVLLSKTETFFKQMLEKAMIAFFQRLKHMKSGNTKEWSVDPFHAWALLSEYKKVGGNGFSFVHILYAAGLAGREKNKVNRQCCQCVFSVRQEVFEQLDSETPGSSSTSSAEKTSSVFMKINNGVVQNTNACVSARDSRKRFRGCIKSSIWFHCFIEYTLITRVGAPVHKGV